MKRTIIQTEEQHLQQLDRNTLRLDLKMDHRNALLFILQLQIIPGLEAMAERDSRPDLALAAGKLKEYALFLDKHLGTFELSFKKPRKRVPLLNGYNYSLTYRINFQPDEEEQVKERITAIMADEYVRMAMGQLIEVFRPIKPKKQPKPKDGKHSRALVRTLAYSTGKDTSQPSLFALSLDDLRQELARQIADSPDGILTKDVMSQKTSICALWLVEKYTSLQKDEQGYVEIEDLNQLAVECGTDAKELKYILFFLTGFQYTHVIHYEEKKEIGLTAAKLFDIVFVYDKSRMDFFTADKKITPEGIVTLLKNERIKYIQVRPTGEFLNDLKGKRGTLGYIRTTDAFLAACNDLSLMAFKILNFSIANEAEYRIGEDKLFHHLGIEKQVKQQGRPRIQTAVKTALQELLDKGHFTKYDIEDTAAGAMYSWTCSEKLVKHTKKKKAEYIDYQDKSIPLETRRERLASWLMTEKRFSRRQAEAQAEKTIPE